MLRPMILLAHGVTILDARASLTYLEASAPLLVALSAAAICRHYFTSFAPAVNKEAWREQTRWGRGLLCRCGYSWW